MSDDQSIYQEVLAERTRQDKQWGGPEHDDSHDDTQWLMFIDYQMDRCYLHPDEVRNRLVKIAALAFAAIESLDRKNAASNRSPRKI